MVYKNFKRVMSFVLSVLMLLALVMPEQHMVKAENEDEAVENVKELLSEIDSLEEMQYYRVTVTETVFVDEKGKYSSANYEKKPEQHLEAQKMYKEYIEDMFAKRAAAKEAYDSLNDEQKAQIAADETAAANLAKLTPYDELPTGWFTQENIIIWQTPQTAEQLALPITVKQPESQDDPYIYEFVRAYEISLSIIENGDEVDYPCTYTLVDSTESGESWTPDCLYEYGKSNYLVAYCCDADVPAHRGMRYKRMNLEDAEYYSDENAARIRTIVQNSYPFISIDEMKQFLIENGLDETIVRGLSRSDLIASVQSAIWHFSNNNPNNDYVGTAGLMEARRARSYLMIPSLHDYRNEDWTWYLIAPNDLFSASGYRYTYYEDIANRTDALTQFLIGLPGTEQEDNQIIISNVEVARTALVPGEDGTYEVDLNVFLNHGTVSADDNVTIEALVISGEETSNSSDFEPVKVDGKTAYQLKVKANDGDTVKIVVNGTQELEKGVYFYQTEGGPKESQCFVNVAEGKTPVHAEESFTFTREAATGIRVYKTANGSNHPISDITFSVYKVNPEDVETISEVPTEEEIEKYATEENLVNTLVTDNTGYGFLELENGTYLVVEELNEEKVSEVAAPFYVTIPKAVEVVSEDGEKTVEYENVVDLYVENIPAGAVAVELEATKQFNDWSKAESFTFELEAVTEEAPLPKDTTAIVTEEEPVATFDKIAFEKTGTYSYTITEVNDGIEGISYDEKAHEVEVVVTRNEEGELVASVKYDDADSLTITNTFTPVEAELKVTKELSGRQWKDDDKFIFTLEAVSENAPLPETLRVVATKDKQTAEFGKISYEKSGKYEYLIKEVKGTADGVKYDEAAHKVTVTVNKDPETNALSAKVDYEGSETLTITNTFTPAEAELKVTKELSGRQWKDDDKFVFTLEAVSENAPLPDSLKVEATRAKQTAEFGKITYVNAGKYEYLIKEEKGTLGGVTYDETSHKVTVTISKDPETNALSAKVDYDGSEELTVVNPYSPKPTSVTFNVKKTVSGNVKNDPVFAFELKEKTKGASYSDTVTVNKEGTVSFKEITFTKTGTYQYKISEVAGKDKNWKYDSKIYEVTVTVTDDGNGSLQAKTTGLEENVAQFKNAYVEDATPDTGDAGNLYLWISMFFASLLSMITIVIKRYRRA